MVHENAEVRKAATAAKTEIKKAFEESYTRTDAFEVLKSIDSLVSKEGDEYIKRLYGRTMSLFKRNGLGLDPKQREVYIKLKNRITDLESEFTQTINEDTTTIGFTLEELYGCPDSFIANLATKTLPQYGPGSGGRKVYLVTMKAPDVLTVMKNAKSSETRSRMYTTYNCRCTQNAPLLAQLIYTRHLAAKVLGYESHAHFRLDENMAKTPETVVKFLKGVGDQLEKKRDADIVKLSGYKKRENQSDEALKLWDVGFFENILRKEEFNVDDELVSQYFPLEYVLTGILKTYENLFNLKFTQITDPQLKWHESVLLYSVEDISSSKEPSHIGYFYLDLFPRPGKYSHQCVLPVVPGIWTEESIKPVAANIGNLRKPEGNKPSLLRYAEVRTFFHEFGHVVHHLCTKSRDSLSGVEIDYLELPSQMLENWIHDPSTLAKLSSHHSTSETLPASLVSSLIQTRHVNAGYAYTRQIFMSLFDMYIHMPEFCKMISLWKQLQKTVNGMDMVEDTMPFCTWYHLAGYDAGYYSYLYSEVFSHDCFSVFKSSSAGCHDVELGMKYRKCILDPGATLDGNTMVNSFLGREPNDKAFLEFVLG
ncbi:hypothetical protein BKA69DRAFT_1026020 [Paraphysoderma sedebokerense]|nr:hypothetical protein BKA69DRAFT_1026020 [Paraphysoderma sedebokerense]